MFGSGEFASSSGYPTTPLAKMPEATRKAVEQVVLGLVAPAALTDTDGAMQENR
jgi:hypothetical protein